MNPAPRSANAYERNYARLEKLLGQPLSGLKADRAYRLRAPGFMDLVVEVLATCEETGGMVLSLAHYFELNGDLCQDPEMTVRLFHPGMTIFQELCPITDPSLGRAEALSFQQAIPPIYQRIYPRPGAYHANLRRELNDFLGLWLTNLGEQGHRLLEPEG